MKDESLIFIENTDQSKPVTSLTENKSDLKLRPINDSDPIWWRDTMR